MAARFAKHVKMEKKRLVKQKEYNTKKKHCIGNQNQSPYRPRGVPGS